MRYQLTEKIEPCADDNEIKEDIKAEIFDEIYLLNDKMMLDLDILTFENQCFQINRILNKKIFFLKVFELKDKSRAIIKQDSEKKNVIRDLSSCITEKFNSFNIIRLEFAKKL